MLLRDVLTRNLVVLGTVWSGVCPNPIHIYRLLDRAECVTTEPNWVVGKFFNLFFGTWLR